MTDENSNNISNLDEETDQISLEELQKQLEKYKITDRKMCEEELPSNGYFDIYASLSTDPKTFGLAKDFSKSGLVARYLGNVIVKDADGKFIDMHRALGFIMAESNGRIIMHSDFGYFGWLNPDDYEILNFVDNFSNVLN